MTKTSIGFFAAIMVAVVLISVSKGRPSFSDETESKANSVSFLVSDIPEHLDMTATVSYNSVAFAENLFFKLFRINGSLEFDGELAENWTISEPESKLTIRLSRNYSFADGSPVGLDDVIASLRRALSDSSMSRSFFPQILGVEAADSQTIVVKYRGWSYTALQSLASPFLSLYRAGKPPSRKDPSSWSTVRSKYRILNWTQVEMRLTDVDANRSVVIVPVEGRTSPGAPIDVMVARTNWVSAGTVRGILGSDDSNYEQHTLDSLNQTIIFLSQKIPLNQRRCLQRSLENSEAMKTTYGIMRNLSFLAFGVIGRSEEKGESLLDVQSLAEVQSDFITIDNDESQALFNLIREPAASCKIIFWNQRLERAAYLKRLIAGDFGASPVTITSLYNDPMFVLSFFFSNSSFNLAQFHSEAFDAAYRSILAVEDKQSFMAACRKAQSLLTADVPAIPIATERNTLYLRKGKKIQDLSIFDVFRWEDVK